MSDDKAREATKSLVEKVMFDELLEQAQQLRRDLTEARREIVLRDHAGLKRDGESPRAFYLRVQTQRYGWEDPEEEVDRLFPPEETKKGGGG